MLARAQRAIDHAGQWWIENHGPIARSPLEAELAEAFQALLAFPHLGYERRWRHHVKRSLAMRCGFHIIYRCRPRLLVIEIVNVVAGSRLHR
ncbi:MAG: type II toxin-antitoxin system RelE/ParE family toxin [Deltaproteobacteria bacterium]|nr:type II toxin-antitoxin system RelE/ParE family toxin [Deltaproteobacteria bacterium]